MLTLNVKAVLDGVKSVSQQSTQLIKTDCNLVGDWCRTILYHPNDKLILKGIVPTHKRIITNGFVVLPIINISSTPIHIDNDMDLGTITIIEDL